MNRNRRPMPKKMRKEMEKEVKKGQKALSSEEELRSNELTSDAMLKHYKKNTHGEVDHRETPPAHIHPENERWQKTLEMQSKGKRKSLTSKLQKRNQNRGK